MNQEKVRLAIDFDSKEELAEWVESLRAGHVLPQDVAVYKIDRYDLTYTRGVTPNNTFLVQRQGSKPEERRLVVEKLIRKAV